jgi:F-type H+-transporting ATPase subunit delta
MAAVATDALAQVYARSLFELADQAGGPEKIQSIAGELEQVVELTREDPAFREFLASPIIDPARRRDALHRIFHERASDLALRFLLVLNGKGRLGHLEPIAEAYDQLVHATFGRIEVDVFTAEPLTDATREALKKRITAALGKEAVLYGYTDPSMIGGLKLRIGDRLIDGSVAGQLRRMRQTLRSPGGEAGRRIQESIERFIEDES